MGQEYFIKSSDLEDKVRQLLPSQGGLGAGFDLSASTQIVPIVDLTESAEGSNVRADLQTALSFTSVTAHAVQNATATIVNTTGYFRIFGACSFESNTTSSVQGLFNLTDGATTKKIVDFVGIGGTASNFVVPYDFVVFLSAGDSLTCQSTANDCVVRGCSRQIADIDGNLVNPL